MKNNPNLSNSAKFLRLGLDLVSPIVLGIFFGRVTDQYFNTTPWLLITFITLGILAGLLNVFRIAKKIV